VHKAECYSFSEDSIDYCRIVKNQKEIKKLNDALKKSKSHRYFCGYEYSFDFVKNNRIVKSVWIQPLFEKKNLLNIISPYFPDMKDSFFVYLKRIPVNISIEEAILNGKDSMNILIADDRELRRWPKIGIQYRFEKKWKSFEESLKKRGEVKSIGRNDANISIH